MKVGPGQPLRLVVAFGTSTRADLDVDQSAHVAALVAAGADLVQELSTYGDYTSQRANVLATCEAPYGTVLTYQLWDALARVRSCTQEQAEEIAIETFEQQLAQGVDYITVHAALTRRLLRRTAAGRDLRAIPVPSRAGAMLMRLCHRHGIDNPLHTAFDALAMRAARDGVVISLGSSMRPAAIADALDSVHVAELEVQGELSHRARMQGASLMLEGLSHAVPADLERYVTVASSLTGGIPVTALGPLPTDIAAGLDHIAAAIGAMFAVRCGIPLVNVVTAKEHLAMPTLQDAIDGIRAARLGAYIGGVMDSGRGSPRDRAMSTARAELDWCAQGEQALFPNLVHDLIAAEDLRAGRPCSICRSKCPFVAAKALQGTVW